MNPPTQQEWEAAALRLFDDEYAFVSTGPHDHADWRTDVLAVMARSGADPRGWITRQTNPRVHRANAAQLNGYEAFAPFAAGVILAQLAGVAADRIAMLSLIFIVLRILHGVVFVAGLNHALRSAVWFGALACTLALLVQAALRVA